MVEWGLPLTGHETFDELAERYLPSPLMYTFGWGRFVMLLAAPFLIPLASVWMAGPRPLTIVLAVAAVLFAGTTLLVRWPPALAVRLDRRGITWRGRTVIWRRITGVEAELPEPGHAEPRTLLIGLEGGRSIPVSYELAQTGEIRSLRNLAQLIEALAVTARAEAERGEST